MTKKKKYILLFFLALVAYAAILPVRGYSSGNHQKRKSEQSDYYAIPPDQPPALMLFPLDFVKF